MQIGIDRVYPRKQRNMFRTSTLKVGTARIAMFQMQPNPLFGITMQGDVERILDQFPVLLAVHCFCPSLSLNSAKSTLPNSLRA